MILVSHEIRLRFFQISLFLDLLSEGGVLFLD